MTENMMPEQECSVIIRSAGERTQETCLELVRLQGIADEQIIVIREAPFSRALRASYEAGIARGHPWTLCLDADVLLLPNAIHQMIRLAQKQPASVFEMRGLILDKFFGGARQGGIHLYRTSLLPLALEVPLQEHIRPEQHVLDAMHTRGYPHRRVNYLVGLHDFEQYNRDIFRKCFVQARKHQEYAEIFLSYWPQQAHTDPDYRVAISGLTAGLDYEGELRIDTRQDIYRERFEGMAIPEKPDLLPSSISPADVAGWAANWQEPAVYHKYFRFEMIAPEGGRPGPSLRSRHLAGKRKELGFFRYMVYFLGWSLHKAGERIQEWVTGQGEPKP